MSDATGSDGQPDEPDPQAEPGVDPDEPVGDFGEPHQSDEGGDSDVDLTSNG